MGKCGVLQTNEHCKGPMNVVLVDWENGAKAPNYPKATANTRLVGREIGLMVKLMVSKMKSKHSLIHLLGHSLGAHISGYAGAYLGGKIARITGLDPAGPFFESYPPIVRLDKSDAKFVDVIHSNGASITSGGAGLRLPVGDVDFYPNGGGYQPGCGNPIRGSLAQLFNGNFQGAGTTIACSHKRAILVFVDSMVSDCLFTSYPCADWDAFNRGGCLDCSWSTGGCSQMGYYADKYKVTGNLYLKTISSSPYCGFNYAVEVTLSNSTKGQVKIRLVGEHGLSDVLELTGKSDTLESGAPIKGIAIAPQALGNIKDVQVFYDKKDSKLFGLFSAGAESLVVKAATVSAAGNKQLWTFNARQTEVSDDTWVSMVTSKTIASLNPDGSVVVG